MDYRYDAFISYRHLPQDKMVAVRLQQLLENHKVEEEADGKKKKRPLRVFRDQSELPTSGDLGGDIRSALEQSRYLIVICSEAIKESKWCMEEINIFRQIHDGSNANILPLLISGEPSEVFPAQLRWEKRRVTGIDGREEILEAEVEPLGADIRGESPKKMMHLLRTEYLRIAAPLLGCGFDDLYRRRQRKKRRQAVTAGAAVLAAAVGFSAYSLYMLNRISEKQMELYANDSLRLASLAEQQREDGDYRLAMLLAGRALPENTEKPERPLVKEAETALRSAVVQQQAAQEKSAVVLQARIPFNVAAWTICRTYAEGTRVAVTDYDNTYLYDTETGKLLFSCTGHEVYFDGDAERAVRVTNLRDLDGEGGVMMDGFLTGSGECYFTGQYSKGSGGYVSFFGVPDDVTGICYVIQETYDETLGKQSFTVADRFDAKGKSLGPEEIPQEIEALCRDSYQHSYFDTRFSDQFRDADYLPGQEGQEKNEEVDYLTEVFEGIGLQVQAVVATDDGELLIFKVYEENGVTYKGYQETLNTIIWSRKQQKLVAVLDGCCYFDRDSGLLYLETYTELSIYSYRPDNFMVDLENLDYYDGISSDGRIYLDVNYDAYVSGVKDAQVQFLDVENLQNPMLQLEIIADPAMDKYLYFTTPNMDKVFVQTPEGEFQLWETQGDCLLTFKEEQNREAVAVAMDNTGTRLAVAYGSGDGPRTVELRSAKDGAITDVVDFSEYEYGRISHMEFRDSVLLVCTTAQSVLIDLEGRGEVKVFPEGNQGYNQERYLTEDGLLFCTQYTNSPFCLSTVYDVDTGEMVFGDTMARTFAYDEETGTLAYQEMNGVSNVSNSVHVAFRGKKGFEDSYTITSQKPNMMLRSAGQSLDGRYLLLNGDDCCEVYELSQGSRVLSLGEDGYGLVGGRLYDLQICGKMNAGIYDILDVGILKNEALQYLTSVNGVRVLTEKEKNQYFIVDQ